MGYGCVDSKTPFEASPKYPILKSRIGLKNVLKMENTFLFTAYFLEPADTFLIIILQISLGIKKITWSFLYRICTHDYNKDVIFK